MTTNTPKTSAYKHPIFHGILLAIAFQLVMALISVAVTLLLPPFFLENGDFLWQTVIEAFMCLAGVGFVALYGYNRIWKEKGSGIKGIVTGGFFIAIGLVSIGLVLYDSIDSQRQLEVPWKIAVYVAWAFLVGICEEVFFRGILSNLFWDKHAKSPAGIWTAAIWSGLIFGLMHLFNMLNSMTADYISSVISQTIGAIMMGIALTAIYYRCRNIRVLIILHGFYDLCAAFSSGVFAGGSLVDEIGSYTPSASPIIIYGIVTLVLLRPSKLNEIVAYRRSQEGFEYGELELPEQQEKSKKFFIFTAVLAVALVVALYSASVALYKSTFYVNYSETNLFAANTTTFEQTVADFTAEESGSISIYVESIPGIENANVRVAVFSDDTVAFEEIYGGACSDGQSIYVEEGKNYRVVVEYDFTQSEAIMDFAHAVSVGIKK